MKWLFGVQVVVVQPLVPSPAAGVQVGADGVPRMIGQVVAIQLLPLLAGIGVQRAGSTGIEVVTGGGHVVAV